MILLKFLWSFNTNFLIKAAHLWLSQRSEQSKHNTKEYKDDVIGLFLAFALQYILEESLQQRSVRYLISLCDLAGAMKRREGISGSSWEQ